MNSILPKSNHAVRLVQSLTAKQQNCTQMLIDCLKVREQHPTQAERIDKIIATIEAVMTENADLLARLEVNLGSDPIILVPSKP
jgi:hypothetical protein